MRFMSDCFFACRHLFYKVVTFLWPGQHGIARPERSYNSQLCDNVTSSNSQYRKLIRGQQMLDFRHCTEDDVVEAFKRGLAVFISQTNGKFGSRHVTIRKKKFTLLIRISPYCFKTRKSSRFICLHSSSNGATGMNGG